MVGIWSAATKTKEQTNLIGVIEEVNRQSMGKRMVMRILQQDGEHFHSGRFCLAGSIGYSSLQSSGTVGCVFASFSSEKIEIPVLKQAIMALQGMADLKFINEDRGCPIILNYEGLILGTF